MRRLKRNLGQNGIYYTVESLALKSKSESSKSFRYNRSGFYCVIHELTNRAELLYKLNDSESMSF